MKKILFSILAITLMSDANMRGAIYSETFNSGGSIGIIPDGSPIGATFRGVISDIPGGVTVAGLTVGLQLSGGYNGNLYAYLVSPNGSMVVLMNQPGTAINSFGAGGAGMNITLSDSSGNNLQNEIGGGILSGTYHAAGSLANFNGTPAAGTWTLFFSDLTSGGGTSTVSSWSLDVTAVPEPIEMALGAFMASFILIKILRLRAVRD